MKTLTALSAYSVWVGGAEVNDHLLNKEEAYALARAYKEDGYDDVEMEEDENVVSDTTGEDHAI